LALLAKRCAGRRHAFALKVGVDAFVPMVYPLHHLIIFVASRHDFWCVPLKSSLQPCVSSTPILLAAVYGCPRNSGVPSR
jgi:hypothetical protein